MKVLIIALDCDGISFALRCQLAGHQVRVWFPKQTTAGDGLITKVRAWQPHMEWADLIFLTENAKLGKELERYFKQKYPILGANQKGAELELDRVVGQEVFERAGVDTLPYEEFSNYDKAAEFVKRENKAFVAKPWGGTSDKALSYVPPMGYEVEAMVWKLGRWKKEGLTGKFILQECQRGTEMGVSGWFGPGGFSRWIEEEFEEKKLCSGGLGPNTGQAGGITKHTQKSKLFDKVLRPIEEQLHALDYVGNINVNCIIDDSGKPWPLEFTCRPGWPDFDSLQLLIQGDPCEWMVDLLEGKDTLQIDDHILVSVVMAHGDYPRGDVLDEEAVGFPIYGISRENEQYIFPSLVRMGKHGPETAGTYVMIVAATGDTVTQAQKKTFDVCKEIKWPSDIIYRDDIGERLKKQLPLLQSLGYATNWEY